MRLSIIEPVWLFTFSWEWSLQLNILLSMQCLGFREKDSLKL